MVSARCGQPFEGNVHAPTERQVRTGLCRAPATRCRTLGRDAVRAVHVVAQEAMDAGAFVFAGGLDEEVSVVATDGTITDAPSGSHEWAA